MQMANEMDNSLDLDCTESFDGLSLGTSITFDGIVSAKMGPVVKLHVEIAALSKENDI